MVTKNSGYFSTYIFTIPNKPDPALKKFWQRHLALCLSLHSMIQKLTIQHNYFWYLWYLYGKDLTSQHKLSLKSWISVSTVSYCSANFFFDAWDIRLSQLSINYLWYMYLSTVQHELFMISGISVLIGSLSTTWIVISVSLGSLSTTWIMIFVSTGSLSTTWIMISVSTGSLSTTWTMAFVSTGSLSTKQNELWYLCQQGLLV